MIKNQTITDSILVVGDGKLTYSVACNLLDADQRGALFAANPTTAQLAVQRDCPQTAGQLVILSELPSTVPCKLVIVVNGESVSEKKKTIGQLEYRVADDTRSIAGSEPLWNDAHVSDSKNPSVIYLAWKERIHWSILIIFIGRMHTD